MRNGRKGEYLDLPFFVGVVVGLPSYMTEPHLEIGAAFPDSPVRLAIFPSWGLYIIRQQANF